MFKWLRNLFKKKEEYHSFIVTLKDGSEELRIYKNGKRVDTKNIIKQSIENKK